MALDNYEAVRKQWQTRISQMDISDLLRRLPFLRKKEDCLEIPYMGEPYKINIKSGVVSRQDSTAPIPVYDELNILTLLWYAKENAVPSGKWVSFSQLKNASPFGPAFQKGNLEPFASTFAGHGDLLAQALTALGGTRLSAGDVGYSVPVFPCIPVQVLFWDADEEFPAQVNLLFDENATDFIHVESIVTIASQLLRHLAVHAELPIHLGAI